MWRKFLITAVVIIGLWFGAVLWVNHTVFSPGGYVDSYLSALEQGSFGEAAARAGLEDLPVALPDSDALITEVTIGQSLAVNATDVVVSAEYFLDGIPSVSLFTVSRLPRVVGLFDRWEFAAAPVATVTASVVGADAVTINGVTLSEDTTQAGVDLLYPGRYTVSWASGWLETDTVALSLGSNRGETVRLVALPTLALESRTTDAVNTYLAGCAERAVLQPASCPFGVTLTDRVVGDVVWEITKPPRVVLAMRDDETTWQVSALSGEATLRVSLQSLFDGTVDDYVETQTIDVTGVIEGLGTDRPRFSVD